ncbi:MAG: flagellar motor switch protein FliG [Terriglobia bacterium]|nr:MAG: flagellar motor switch protein FliG [Terriglobia bacterium]
MTASVTSGFRKAAILLTSISDEAGAAILRQLTEDEVHEVTREISLLGKLTDEERHEVLAEFVGAAENPRNFHPGGVEYATSVILAAFGPDHGKRITERLLESIKQEPSDVESIRKADPLHLAKIVQREHPRTIALILCQMDPASAGRVLGGLPQETRVRVARSIASLDQVSPDIVGRLANLIQAKLQIAGDSRTEPCGGVRAVADLLNRVEPATGEEILQAIDQSDPTLGQSIRQLMFVFEDMLNLGQDALRKLLAQVDRKILTMALKGSSPDIKKHFTSVMSSRAAEMLMEDMAALGPVRIRDVQEAQQAVIAIARSLQEKGEISLASASSDEFVE